MRKLFLIQYLLLSIVAMSQIPGPGGIDNLNPMPLNMPSPNAASLGLYGQIPVNLFSGLPNINIPLYSLENVELSLSYHSGGVKPEEHPGWVGLGWNLNVGGAITRIVNGGVDEVLEPSLSDISTYSYYDHYDILDIVNDGWFNEANMTLFATNMDHILQEEESRIPIPYPDEFIFNFYGYSGSFFLNHKGKWIVKSSQPISFKIKEYIERNFILTDDCPWGYYEEELTTYNLERIISGFSLVTEDGTEYVFGNTYNSIEFSSTSPKRDIFNTNYIATTWYLTKILKPNGKEINFEYAKDNRAVYRQSITTSIYDFYASGSSLTWYKLLLGIVNPLAGLQMLINPDDIINSEVVQDPKIENLQRFYLSYLKKISTDNLEIDFSISRSNELDYFIDAEDLIIWEPEKPRNDYNNTTSSTGIQGWLKWHKLDEIIVNDKSGTQKKKFKFEYDEDPTKRLVLDELHEFGNDNNKTPKKYFFKYNTTPLPEYNSGEIDHWGFYNGKNYFDTHDPEGDNNRYTKLQAESSDYYDSRQPDQDLMKAGILEKIIYPTGGYTEFEYEPHYYSKVVIKGNNNIFDINAVDEDSAGGLRIKFIKSYSDINSPPTIKEYFYENDYLNGDHTSSGILGGKPKYFDDATDFDGVIDYWFWNSYSIEPLSFTNGNHVTYTKVVERNSNNGFVEYTYSNHDKEEYRDTYPNSAIYVFTNQEKHIPFNSKSLERGKLLSEKYYNENNDLVKKISYKYNKKIKESDESIRAISVSNYSFGQPASWGPYTDLTLLSFGTVLSAFDIYSHYIFLEEVETTEYNNGEAITTVNTYKYNSNNQIVEKSVVNSLADTTKVLYKYPSDYTANLVSYDTKEFGCNNTGYLGVDFTINYQQKVKLDIVSYYFEDENGEAIREATIDIILNKEGGGGGYYYANTTGIFYVDLSPGTYSLNFDLTPSGGDVYSLVGFLTYGNTIPLGDSQSEALFELKNRNIINKPIERVVEKDGKVVDGKITFYKIANSEDAYVDWRIVPIKETQLELNVPISITVEDFLSTIEISENSGVFNYSNNYTDQIYYDAFDSYSNILQYHTENNLPISYMWAYKKSYPIIKAENIEYENSSISIDLVRSVGNAPIGTSTTIEEFIDSINSSGGFFNADGTFNTVNKSAWEIFHTSIRNALPNALISFYTYDALVGMTSQTDPNGKTTYYEYDSFGRLEFIKDHKGNVLKKYDYHYAETNP